MSTWWMVTFGFAIVSATTRACARFESAITTLPTRRSPARSCTATQPIFPAPPRTKILTSVFPPQESPMLDTGILARSDDFSRLVGGKRLKSLLRIPTFRSEPQFVRYPGEGQFLEFGPRRSVFRVSCFVFRVPSQPRTTEHATRFTFHASRVPFRHIHSVFKGGQRLRNVLFTVAVGEEPGLQPIGVGHDSSFDQG